MFSSGKKTKREEPEPASEPEPELLCQLTPAGVLERDAIAAANEARIASLKAEVTELREAVAAADAANGALTARLDAAVELRAQAEASLTEANAQLMQQREATAAAAAESTAAMGVLTTQLNSVVKESLCIVCGDPSELLICFKKGHGICKSCEEPLRKGPYASMICPCCRGNLLPTSVPNLSMANAMMGIGRQRCINHVDGCPVLLKPAEMEGHLGHEHGCQFVMVDCPHLGCAQVSVYF